MHNVDRSWGAIITSVLALAVIASAMITFMPATMGNGSDTVGSAAAPIASVYSPPADHRIKLEIYGDSITQGDTSYGDTSTGAWSPRSWPLYLSREFLYVGGFARGGMTTGDLLKNDNLQASINGGADYLIIELGTNDLIPADRSHDTFWSNITAIVEKQKYSPEEVIIVLVGPEEKDVLAVIHREWNELTLAKAHKAGYHVIDPWAAKMATAERTWADPAYHFDSKHPTREGAKILGEEISRQILEIHSKK